MRICPPIVTVIVGVMSGCAIRELLFRTARRSDKGPIAPRGGRVKVAPVASRSERNLDATEHGDSLTVSERRTATSLQMFAKDRPPTRGERPWTEPGRLEGLRGDR